MTTRSHPLMISTVSHQALPHSLEVLRRTTDEGAEHMTELTKLAEKDPEFYKYLQENDKELLDFDPDAQDDEMDEDDEDIESEEVAPVLTLPVLKKWAKALLEVSKILSEHHFVMQRSRSNVLLGL